MSRHCIADHFAEAYKSILLTASVNSPLGLTSSFHIPNSITMRFSFFAVLSGLAALTVVNALPVENLQHDGSSEGPCDGKSGFSS